jgi:hypothetical protein
MEEEGAAPMGKGGVTSEGLPSKSKEWYIAATIEHNVLTAHRCLCN